MNNQGKLLQGKEKLVVPITINTNISSLNAQRQLGKSTAVLADSFTRLSSGLRINKASDDAAGLSIATDLNLSSRVYSQAIRNINDGINTLNIAESAVQELTTIVIRQKELAEQAANSIYSYSQKTALNKEASALTAEYNRITRTTQMNNLQLLNGSLGSDGVTLQQGFGAVESTSLQLGKSIGRLAGTGTFNSPVSYLDANFSENLYTPQVADVTGDGFEDILAFDDNSDAVFMYQGNGDGTFRIRATVARTSGNYLGLNDLDNDGKYDLVVTGATNMVVLYGNGNGTFLAPITSVGTNSSSIQTITDLNNDGLADIITGGANTDSLNIFLNRGNRNFSLIGGPSYTSSNLLTSIEAGDFNNDGKQDLIVSTAAGSPNFINTYLGNGDGTFLKPITINSYSYSLKSADLNRDGILDLVEVNTTSPYVDLHFGNGNGTFRLAGSYYVGSVSQVSGRDATLVADFNDDEIVDIAGVVGSDSYVGIILGNVDGSFKAPTSYFIGNFSMIADLAKGDFNRDGIVDIVGASTNIRDISVMIGKSDASRYVTTVEDVDLRTKIGVKSAMDILSTRLQNLALEISNVGAYQSRLESSLSVLSSRRIGYDSAASQILDADVATETAALLSNKIKQSASSIVATQANQQNQFVIDLLR